MFFVLFLQKTCFSRGCCFLFFGKRQVPEGYCLFAHPFFFFKAMSFRSLFFFHYLSLFFFPPLPLPLPPPPSPRTHTHVLFQLTGCSRVSSGLFSVFLFDFILFYFILSVWCSHASSGGFVFFFCPHFWVFFPPGGLFLGFRMLFSFSMSCPPPKTFHGHKCTYA